MGNFIAIGSVVLALFAAGCIAYVAWVLTSEASGPADRDRDERPDDEAG